MAAPKKKRIMLIEPPFWRLYNESFSLDRYPLALGYLAGMIRRETDWEVMAYNADFSYSCEKNMDYQYLAGEGFNNYLKNLKALGSHIWKEIKSTILEYDPSVIGISAKSQNFASARIVAEICKDITKEMIVIVGGPHPTMVGAEVMKCSAIDVCVKGEGEKTIVELLKAIENNNKCDDILGIIYRKDGHLIENAPRRMIQDLDALCFPHDYAPEVLRDYDMYSKNVARIFATRGCSQNCFFCGSRKIWGRKTRFRSPDNVVREILNLHNRGIKRIHFDDDIFGVNNEYLKNLCNALIKNCSGITWSCEIHAKLINDENLSVMKASGCNQIQLGVESGDNNILKVIRKNITIEDIYSAIKLIKKHSINLCVFFMIGFPQETEETLRNTIKAIKKIKDARIIYNIFNPYPGTEAFEYCRQIGIVNDNYDVSLFNHHSPLACFTPHIKPERFRSIASKIERMVDRKNKWIGVKEILRLDHISRTRFWEKGLKYYIRRGPGVIVRNIIKDVNVYFKQRKMS